MRQLTISLFIILCYFPIFSGSAAAQAEQETSLPPAAKTVTITYNTSNPPPEKQLRLTPDEQTWLSQHKVIGNYSTKQPG